MLEDMCVLRAFLIVWWGPSMWFDTSTGGCICEFGFVFNQNAFVKYDVLGYIIIPMLDSLCVCVC